MKKRVGDSADILYYMDDLKASMSCVETEHNVHETMMKYAESVGMAVNKKKSAIQLNIETSLPESLQDMPRMDEVTYRYLGFETKKGEVARNDIFVKLEERIRKAR